ncbi:putative zinc transporter msc2 [Teratosphaeriaceae sp. CCFEE 6253]|nr:putative zinc transporter msc2 [Teratosphaeriaceae sp. CCFEE 6253]
MASGYALPVTNGGSPYHQGHGRSYSNNPSYLSPIKSASNGFVPGHGLKKASSHNGLYTHAETSPLPSPAEELYKTPFETNTFAFENNGRLHAPPPPSSWHTRVKSASRPRGESDLGRPADPRSAVYRPTLERLDSMPPAKPSWFSLPEALTALLIPLPYLLASAAYSVITHEELSGGTHELPAYARIQRGAGGQSRVLPKQHFSADSGLVEACTLTSGTLLLVGILAKLRAAERTLDRRKGAGGYQQQMQGLLSLDAARKMTLRALSLGLPYFSAMQIGGFRTGLVLLTATAADLFGADTPGRRTLFEWKHILSARTATLVVLVIGMATDFAGWTFHAPTTHMLGGYLALAISVFVLPPPLPSLAVPSSSSNAPSRLTATSSLTASTGDASMTLLSGAIFTLLTVIISVVSSTSPSITGGAITFSTLSIAATAAAIFFSQPHTLRSSHQAGLGLGCLLTAAGAFLYSPSLWPGTIVNGGLSALSLLGVLYDTHNSDDHEEAHEHAHNTHKPTHAHHPPPAKPPTANSRLTNLILSRCEPGSLLHGILREKDSRRIAYFTLLNFAFMFVQGVYGYLSGSLGLLSDTVHMFFDCFGLVVGLGASVASKWPESPEKPYGWGKLNTLAGFGNGVFLMLVSVEFVWEAIEGITEGTELRHVGDLLVVSVCGLVVNMVGLFAFEHAHAGHDHGHGHGHGGDEHKGEHDHHGAHEHGHSHEHGHPHDHSHSHANGHAHGQEGSHAHAHDAKPNPKPQPQPQTPAHGHAHDHAHNDNMHGIFLHVAADAGGSLAVILSTALTLWQPWYLWDPLAAILIAVLIFAAAVPLVLTSGRKLLLVIPDELEYGIKNTLQELSGMRGVAGYAAPRFWVDDRGEGAGKGGGGVVGVIHVFAAQGAEVEDVRGRVGEFARERGMELVVQVEREGDGSCWCGGGGGGGGGGGVLKAG